MSVGETHMTVWKVRSLVGEGKGVAMVGRLTTKKGGHGKIVNLIL